MGQLYRNFPEGMKDHEIIKCINEYTIEIIESGAQVNKMWQLTPLIQLGQYELAKRQSKRITHLTTGISIISMFVAGVALWVAINNSHASTQWEKSQLEILEQIKTKIQVVSSSQQKIQVQPVLTPANE